MAIPAVMSAPVDVPVRILRPGYVIRGWSPVSSFSRAASAFATINPLIPPASIAMATCLTGGSGGFCYELNGLFALLLKAIGFKVTLLSARVFSRDQLGPAEDHLTLFVECDDLWLVDVGFGDSFVYPLLLFENEEQQHSKRSYRLDRAGSDWIFNERLSGGDWEKRYLFTQEPHEWTDFTAMCHYHQ